jgi:hypothetical protein
MPTFQILDDGYVFATVVAASMHAPASSVKGGEDFFAPYSGLVQKGERYLSPVQYARLLGGNGFGSVREIDADGNILDEETSAIYVACIDVWAYWEKSVRAVPVAVLSVNALDRPALEAIPILHSASYIRVVDQFKNDLKGVAAVADDLGLSLLEPHSAATVFGKEIYELDSAQAVAETLFGVPSRSDRAARRVLRRG